MKYSFLPFDKYVLTNNEKYFAKAIAKGEDYV